MNKKLFWGVPVLIFAIGGVAWLKAGPLVKRPIQSVLPGAALQATTTPTFGPVATTPNLIAANTPTQVTVTALITDPNVISTGVNLLRLIASGTTILGVMRDDGASGDVVAGDKVYTLRLNFNENTAAPIQLQVSAAFRGFLRRVTSTAILEVWPKLSVAVGDLTIMYPPSWFTRQQADKVVISNVRSIGVLSTTTLQTEAYFDIRFIPNTNPALLPVDQWFDRTFASGLSSDPLSRTSMTVDGRPAVRIETSEIGRRVHIYVLKGIDVIEISYGLFAPSFTTYYERMVTSIKL